MLGVSSHAWKVNFCKFTNETRNGIEDSSPHSRPQVPRRGQRRLRRRRLRAGAGLRRDRPGRRPLVVGEPARGAAARRAARHRRPDARHRQAPRAPRPRRHLLHQRRRRARPAREGLAAGRRRSPSRRSSPQTVQERARAARRGRATARPTRKGVALTPLERTIEADALRYAHVDVEIDRARRTATFTVQGAARRAAGRRRRDRGRRRRLVAAAMARELDDAILSLRTNELDIGTWLLKTEGDAARGARAGRDAARAPATTGSCARRIGLLRRTLRAPRRLVAHAVRADRARLVLRRHAARARARRRPQLHAGAARRRGARAEAHASAS